MTKSTFAPVRRSGAALLLLAALGALFAWLTLARPADDGPPPPAAKPTAAQGHAAAAFRQNAYPTTHQEALERIDRMLAIDMSRVSETAGGWLSYATIAGDHLERARLTGDYRSFAEAAAMFERAFAVGQGFGPQLERASFNLAVHRLDRVEPDLKRREAYALAPDIETRATIMGMRGDLAFYRGDYAGALGLYRQARKDFPSVQASLRLANYWAAAGDPDLALRFLTEAENFISGAQQQVFAGMELQRGNIALARGRWDEAAAHYAKADDIFPGHFVIEEHRALMLGLRGDIAGAVRRYERVAARDGSAEAMDALAGLARARGDVAASKAWAARAGAVWATRIALMPEAAYGHAIDHEINFGDPARALAYAQANYRARPYAQSAIALAAALQANARAAEALKILQPVLRSDWVSAEQHVLAAELYALTGDAGAAEAQREAALAINPRSFDRNPGLVWLHQ